MRRHMLDLALLITLVGGATACLPTLEDSCADDAQCPADRICIGGVCAPRSEDGSIDGAPLPFDGGADAAADARPPSLDGASPAGDGDPPVGDGAPPIGDQGPMPDSSLLGDAGCTIVPSACNQLDDNCNGEVDEQGEAVEACPAVPGTLAQCAGGGGCQYVCEDGAVPLGDDPAEGCRIPRGCALEGDWVEVATGFEKGSDEAQQIVVAASGDTRFVAAYDLLADRREAVVRSFTYPVDEPEDAVEVRLGAIQETLPGDLTDMSAVAVGERFVVGARVDGGGDVGTPVHLMARDADEADLRTLRTSWPQAPALAALDGENTALLTLVEGHINEADPPFGATAVDLWAEGEAGAWAVAPRRVTDRRETGPAGNAAFVLGDGAVAMAGDVVSDSVADGPSYALRIDRLTAEMGLAGSLETPLDGEVVSRISVVRSNAGFIIFTAVDSELGELQWHTLRADGSEFVGQPVSVPWYAPPVDPHVLDLRGGPGVLYLEGEHARIALPDPGIEDFAFEGRLPDAPNKVRAVAAIQTGGGAVEVALLRESGGEGVVIHGRYVCQ